MSTNKQHNDIPESPPHQSALPKKKRLHSALILFISPEAVSMGTPWMIGFRLSRNFANGMHANRIKQPSLTAIGR
jgi:hypothetical protein